jgi:hypothetical protein
VEYVGWVKQPTWSRLLAVKRPIPHSQATYSTQASDLLHTAHAARQPNLQHHNSSTWSTLRESSNLPGVGCLQSSDLFQTVKRPTPHSQATYSTQCTQLASRLSNITTGQITIGSENVAWPPEDRRKDARNMLRNNWLPIKSLIVASSCSHIYLLTNPLVNKSHKYFSTKQGSWFTCQSQPLHFCVMCV